MKLKLIFKLLQMLVKDRLFYPGQVVVELVALLSRCGLLLLIYAYVFKQRGGDINGNNFTLVAWSLFFYFCFSSLRLRNLPFEVINDIKTGAVETLFAKPIPYVQYKFFWQVGLGLFPFLVNLLFGITLLYFWIGFPSQFLDFNFWLSFSLALSGCFVLCGIIYSLVGLTAFWLEEASPVCWVIDKMIMVLGGSYLPVALFPEFMLWLAKYSPFGASQFITHSLTHYWSKHWLSYVSIQFFWIVVLGTSVLVVYKAAHRRLTVNGG